MILSEAAYTQNMTFYAHTAEDKYGNPLPKAHWQLLKDHLGQVAGLAKRCASSMGLQAEATLAGLLHDLGKYSERFQARLDDNSIRGINHWAAGAQKAFELKAPLVAYAIDGHHTGLPEAGDLLQSMTKMADAVLAREHTKCAEPVAQLMTRLAADGIKLPSAPSVTRKDHFASALHTRFLFSCLVDADFLDTEKHFDPDVTVGRIVPPLQVERALELLQTALAAKQADGPVNQLRREVLADCIAVAKKPVGLFTLTAPTGSGKTLSSLAFALQHIIHHNAMIPADDARRFRRVIFVIPYTSIIEQTSQVFRELFETEFGPDYVLEHHSAVSPRDTDSDAEEERLRRARLAAENWASPLIVTTSVQFFESLFGHKPRDCRKLHNITRSVVLFDEVQTLPAHLLPSLLSAVRLLTQEPYGMTAVFMTATQPAFASAGAALPYGWRPVEISSNPGAMSESLRRTRIELPQRDDRRSWQEVASKLNGQPQALCVVNTTAHAREIFRLLSEDNPFHLSARLCPAHRQEKLKLIRELLVAEQPCRLVSTQLIEAGSRRRFSHRISRPRAARFHHSNRRALQSRGPPCRAVSSDRIPP